LSTGVGLAEIPQVSIISDNDAARWAVAEVIRTAGFEVEVFGSAEKFILSDKVTRTACLVVDVQQTGMNGLQLQSHLSAAGRHIPMVFIVALVDERSRALALEVGAVNVLDRSFGDKALLEEVRAIVKPGKGETRTSFRASQP
jgi:FixJ family two-component response regulator